MTIATGRETLGVAHFCPKCGSPSVSITQTLVSAGSPLPAVCSACGWDGDSSELSVAPFRHEFASDEEIATMVMRDLRGMLAREAAQTYGRCLIKWGFLDQPISPQQLGAYMTAIARAAATAIIETRKKLIEEKSNGSASPRTGE